MRLADILLNSAAALAVVCLVHGGFHPISTSVPAIIPNTATGLVIALALSIISFGICIKRQKPPQMIALPWFALLSILLLSDIPSRWPTCFHGGLGLPHIVAAGALAWVVAPYITRRAGVLIWLIGAATAYLGLLESTHGNLLFSDDHPAFLYRLEQLKEQFPAIPFYNPMWNGGVEAREFFPSGILNVFFLLAPLLYVLDITTWYNELVALLLFIIHPACTFLAVKVLRLKAPLAPVLALFSSTLWFRYQFPYGTLGFLTSTALVPLFFALLIRILMDGAAVSWRLLASFVVVATLTFFWSPAIFILAPGVFAILPQSIRFLATRKGALVVAALFLLNIPWVLIFLEASKISNFITTQQTGEVAGKLYPRIGKLLDDARYVLKGSAPALILLTIPGLFLIRRAQPLTFRVLGTAIFVLFTTGLFIAPLKPRMELGRFMVVAIYLCCIPASVALADISKKMSVRLLSALGIGSVILIPAITYVFTANRTLERYSPYSPELPGLIQALKKYNQGGRVVFSGYTQHQLDGGHVTPLPLFASVPLYASRYQHDRWDHTDFIPTQFRKYHDVGVENFFDLYNINAIAVPDVEWLPWFTARPDFYTKVWQGNIFTIFQRRFGPRSWFFEGNGEVLEQEGPRLVVRVDTPSVILRFNYLPFLEVDGCESITPAAVFEAITFIQLDGCKVGGVATITAKSAIARTIYAQ